MAIPNFNSLLITSIAILTISPLLSLPTAHSCSIKTLAAPITKNVLDYYTIPLTPNSSAAFVVDTVRPILAIDYSLSKYVTMTIPYKSPTCEYMFSILGRGSCTKYWMHDPVYCNPNVVFPRYHGCHAGDLSLANITLSYPNYEYSTTITTVPEIFTAQLYIKASLESDLLAGIVGLTWSPFSLPLQLSSKLKIKQQFGLCLPSNSRDGITGVAFFGDIPLGINTAVKLAYTPLKKFSYWDPGLYFSIKNVTVNKKLVDLSSSLNSSGFNPFQISTTDIATSFRSDIYRPILKAFSDATRKIQRMEDPGKRYKLCFNKTAVPSTRTGYNVPQIDLILEGGKTWAIYGANLLMDGSNDITCFAFLDGGTYNGFGTIGAFMLENNLLVFDLARSRLGFSRLLLRKGLSCSDPNLIP